MTDTNHANLWHHLIIALYKIIVGIHSEPMALSHIASVLTFSIWISEGSGPTVVFVFNDHLHGRHFSYYENNCLTHMYVRL